MVLPYYVKLYNEKADEISARGRLAPEWPNTAHQLFYLYAYEPLSEHIYAEMVALYKKVFMNVW